MVIRQLTAVSLAIVMALSAVPLAFAQQPAAGQLAGTAKDEAKKPYTDYLVRARSVVNGQVAATSPLDTDAKFVLPKLDMNRFLVELVLVKNNKVVCTEGPFTLTTGKPVKDDVKISCGVPAALWLLPAAAAAGITTAIVRREPASGAGK